VHAGRALDCATWRGSRRGVLTRVVLKIASNKLKEASMGTINDGEFLPSPEVLAPFRHEAGANVRPLGRDFWERLDLSEDKSADLVSKHRQDKAVTRFVKNYLEQQLQSFGILYAAACFSVLGLNYLGSLIFYHSGVSDKLMVIAVANIAYYGFIMMLGLFYPLARKVRWQLTVAAFLLITLLPLVQDQALALMPPAAVLALVVPLIPASLIFITATGTGRSLWGRLKEVRRRNAEENSNREEFMKRVTGMFTVPEGRIRAFKRRMILKSALRLAFPILRCEEIEDKKGAILDFAKRQKFQDSMGRLTEAAWIVGSLAYLILPKLTEIDTISSWAAGVLPVYYCSMKIMKAVDNEREKVLTEVAELIKSGTDVG
jgi:hypothetical protein